MTSLTPGDRASDSIPSLPISGWYNFARTLVSMK